ncbi:hypothetical protein WQ54_00515 [Bacillus sp. SA1-12]|uniref:hypothetical protein n=1 Tax=Bacillus sp. SA1-12 TaxID=1455638 RepID=UPI0006266946|nr:hypothetical protein [Bacillus sp. SA1-12]KKI94061.1 hypothetical protein WQ54_00515 [Bacillus sp. SA1-12]
MKVFITIIFVLFLSISTNIIIDLLSGFKLSKTMLNLLNPFWVIETGEYVMLVMMCLIIIVQQIFMVMKNKADNQKGSN